MGGDGGDPIYHVISKHTCFPSMLVRPACSELKHITSDSLCGVAEF